ncbi:hypothetical protein B0H16DRAFT_1903151 [Mycena metata]|uniref:Uncharacterized protein n=1 Tax=Mycena metata TaxID=1033252 RepID=A0AAD7DV60_9AGAR|nr:hypothetical protein B0H16DRAFT_1903151 [Mycena metata]
MYASESGPQPLRPFGTVDQATSYDPRLDIKRAARSQQYAVETGKNLHIRPAMAESAQTKYLGVEEKAFGQEIHRAIFGNARMLIHDPDTGMPGIRTGHLYAELHTNPVEPYCRWPLEVPCVSHQDVQAAIRPRFNRREARKWKATHAAHQLTTAVRETPPISVGMLLKPIGLQDILKQNHAPTHYLIHPPNEPPPFDTSRMTTIGTTRGAESPETCKRPDTPRLPWILTTIRPEMADENVGHKNIDHDDLVGNNGSGNTESTAAEEPADTESTVARNVDVEMREQTSADEEEIDELFDEPVQATERGFGVVHDNGNTLEYADALERLEDDEEMEEGEIKEDARPLDSVPIDSSDRTTAAQPMDPRQGDSGDHSPNPDFALTRTRLITRAHYSSSPSAPCSDSSDDFPPYDTLLQSDTTPYPTLPDKSPTPREIFDNALASVVLQPDFDPSRIVKREPPIVSPRPQPGYREHIILLSDSDSSDLPDLVSAPSDAEISPPPTFISGTEATDGGSDDRGALSEEEGFVVVATQEMVQAMHNLHHCAPTPRIRRNYFRVVADAYDDGHTLKPLQNAIHVITRGLEAILDRVAMARASAGEINGFTQMLKDDQADIDRYHRQRMLVNTNRLDLVSQRVNNGKRKMREDPTLPPSQDGRSVRVFSQDAQERSPAFRNAIAAEVIANCTTVSTLTKIREDIGDFIHRASLSVARRHWTFDLATLHDSCHVPLPFLFGDEYAKLRLLHDVYRKHGHHAVVEEIETLMSFRFSKSQVIAHLLYSGMLETTPKLPDSFPSAAANVRLDGRNHTDALGRNLPGNTESRPPGLLRRDTQHRPKTRFSTKNCHGHRSERGSTVDRVIEVRPTLSDEPPSHHVNFRPVVRNEHGNWRFARLPDIVDVYEIHLDHMYQGHPRTTQIT